jgi:hypothetical protein
VLQPKGLWLDLEYVDHAGGALEQRLQSGGVSDPSGADRRVRTTYRASIRIEGAEFVGRSGRTAQPPPIVLAAIVTTTARQPGGRRPSETASTLD